MTRKVMRKIVAVVFGAAAFFIGARIVLELAGANPFSPFVAFVYRLSDVLVFPFRNMFYSSSFIFYRGGASSLIAGSSVLDTLAVTVLVIYTLLVLFLFLLLS